jgi:aminoglycoside phosphotransferase (APT) family kinase protein
VPAPPAFESLQEYVSHLGDVALWAPHVAAVLDGHDLPAAEPVAGFNPTYPTFVCGDAVVKFFGHRPRWRETHAAEAAAHALVATDPEILAPRVLAEGELFEDADTPWPYLVTSRVRGAAWPHANLPLNRRIALAAELGRQVRRIHALDPGPIAKPPAVAVEAAATRSSLPPHLVAQVDDFVAELGPPDPVFVHGDLCDMHVFVDDGRLAGLIDWGDATVADRHYELIQVYRSTLRCDKTLFREFLAAAAWPIGRDFPRRVLGYALRRQATGLAQHNGMDVFEPIAERFPLHEIATLDALAQRLFAL